MQLMVGHLLVSVIHQGHVDMQPLFVKAVIKHILVQAIKLSHHTTYAVAGDGLAVFPGRDNENHPER